MDAPAIMIVPEDEPDEGQMSPPGTDGTTATANGVSAETTGATLRSPEATGTQAGGGPS